MSLHIGVSRFLRRGDRIRHEFEAAVIFLHHPGHTNKQRSAGSINLAAAIDGSGHWEVNGRYRTLTITMLRDGDCDQPAMRFELVTVEIGTNNGVPIQSACLKFVDEFDDFDEEFSDDDQLLIEIAASKPRTQKELVDRLGSNKSVISRDVGKLIQAGLLKPRSLTITEAGRARLAEIKVTGGEEP